MSEPAIYAKPRPIGQSSSGGNREANGVTGAQGQQPPWSPHQVLRDCLERLLGVRINNFRNRDWPRRLRLPARYRRVSPADSQLKVSIVTPSYNQGGFLERTIQSVLGQGYPHLQYIVQDGGSRDETLGILARYRDKLAHWESRPDNGQAHAINLGFQHADGDVLAYLNSDDLLLPGALHYVMNFLAAHPDVDVVYGHRIIIDEEDREVSRWVLPPHDEKMLAWTDYIPQETLFWRRRIWERVGGTLDESFHFAMDWDLLLRFRDQGARFVRLPRFLGAFRLHTRQKTATMMADRCLPECSRLYERYGIKPRYRHMLPYLFRHALYQRLHELGVLRY